MNIDLSNGEVRLLLNALDVVSGEYGLTDAEQELALKLENKVNDRKTNKTLRK